MTPCSRCADECGAACEARCQGALLAGNEEPAHRHHDVGRAMYVRWPGGSLWERREGVPSGESLRQATGAAVADRPPIEWG